MRLGDAWVIPTLLAYGARWVWLMPVAVIAPLLFWKRSTLIPLALAFGIWLVPVMQFQWPHIAAAERSCPLTVVTLNADQRADPAAFRKLLDAESADIVAMQEWEEKAGESGLSGWTVRCAGQLCLGSRHGIRSVEVLDRGTIGGYHAMAVAADVATANGPVSFFAVHLETVRKGIEPVLHAGAGAARGLRANLSLRELESRTVQAWIHQRSRHSAIVAGDFNMPTDSAIYRRNWAGWSDAFQSAGAGFGHTKFTSLWGIRIDHVLFDDSWQAVSSRVGPDIGSDHRPLIATLQRLACAPRRN